MVIHSKEAFRWDGVGVHPYKEDGGTHFKSITRQTLFHGAHDLQVEYRYFEILEDGYSTLERHQHSHLVMVIRGCGEVLVGDVITPIELNDVVQIPPMTWHQFRANRGRELGFLCVVAVARDKPQRPGPQELEELNQNPAVGAFIRV